MDEIFETRCQNFIVRTFLRRKDGVDIFEGVNAYTEEPVLIKIEPKGGPQKLSFESTLLSRLEVNRNFPQVQLFHEGGDSKTLVTSHPGRAVKPLLRKAGPKALLSMGLQLVSAIETVHRTGLVLRVLDPETLYENVRSGANSDAGHFVIASFFNAKFFRNEATGEHIKMRNRNVLISDSVPLFLLSENAVSLRELSRRDDLECLARLLVFIAHIEELDPLQQKDPSQTPLSARARFQELLEDPKVPKAVRTLFAHSTALGFEEAPNYALLRRVFSEEMTRNGFVMDYIYEWDLSQDTEVSRQELAALREKTEDDLALLEQWGKEIELAEKHTEVDLRPTYDFTEMKKTLLMLFSFDEINLLEDELTEEDKRMLFNQWGNKRGPPAIGPPGAPAPNAPPQLPPGSLGKVCSIF